MEIPITEGEHTVYIRERMNFGTRKRVEGAAIKVGTNGATVSPDVGLWQLALLAFNITRWDGPLLQGKYISIDTIENLDPALDDLMERALEEIAARNPQPMDEDEKKGSTSRGASASKANGQRRAATTIAT